MSPSRTYGVFALTLLAAASLQAVTYVVPSDRDLVRRADVVVIATASASHAERNELGGIATVTSFTIDDQLKGEPLAELQVTEPGGSIDGRIMFIPGAPAFAEGTRYLLFLHRMPNGKLTSYGLGLGRFAFTSDINGRALVARGASGSAIGWDERDGSPYIEKLRGAAEFFDFIRTVAKNPDAPVAENYVVPGSKALSQLVLKPAPNFLRTDYLWSSNLRWNNNATAAFGYCCSPTFQPVFDGPGGATAAAAMWTATGAIHYSVSGPSTANKGLTAADGSNTVLFNDPQDFVSGFGPGVVALGGVTSAVGTYPLDGQTFFATQEVDVVVAKTTQFPAGISQATFNAVIAHEMGHSLGFRHADGTGDSASPPPNCAAPSPCSTGFQALMEHIVGRASLGQWDIDAANTVYGAGPPPCTSPTSVSASANPASINAGGSATLTATVSGGTSPFSYQWYTGNSGNTANQVPGGTSAQINVSPTSTTSYWVRATATCGGTPADSSSVTVTVAPCAAPSGITASASSTTVSAGSPVTLTASVAGGSQPFTYSWTGNGVFLGGGAQITLVPSANTNYQVTVSNACSTGVVSNVVAVTVTGTPCTAPANVTVSASSTNINSGQSVTLTAAVPSGSQPFTYQWFANNVAISGNSQSITATPTATTSYRVVVSNSCSSGVSSTNNVIVNVTVVTTCSTTVSSVTASPNPALPGQSFTLTANATTTSGTLSYQWYRGSINDTSGGVLSTSSTFTTSETATTNYWVNVTSSCGGTAQTGQATVTLNTGTCGTNPNQLCINGARYRVTLSAKDPSGKTGQGTALYQSNVFGYFSLPDFSPPSDPQIFVKVVGPIPGPNGPVPWVFYSGLTNLDYTVNVVDTTTGQTFNSYHVAAPDPGSSQSIGDFDVFGARSGACAAVTITEGQANAGGSCGNGANALCLLNRFNVIVRAKNNPTRGTQQVDATALPVNSQFGFFTTPPLSDPTDVQAFVKMIDATIPPFNAFWVFLGGLTDFDLTVTVTDTRNGKQKIYNKPAGSTCGLNDTHAFAP